MYNPFSLEGKTILVTGASSGIGRAVAVECSKMGAKVIITARNEERLFQTLTNLEGEGHQMIICDLNVEEDVDKMIVELPKIDGLVNNAGILKTLPVQYITQSDINKVFQLNTISPMLFLQKILKKKIIKKGGSVVFSSSLAGVGTCAVGNSIYTATKGAISAFVRCAALELARKKIRVNAVCPAMVETDILKVGSITKEQLEFDAKNYPLGRYGYPNDIAWAIIYLLSDASCWVTGDNIVIDGGVSLK